MYYALIENAELNLIDAAPFDAPGDVKYVVRGTPLEVFRVPSPSRPGLLIGYRAADPFGEPITANLSQSLGGGRVSGRLAVFAAYPDGELRDLSREEADSLELAPGHRPGATPTLRVA